MTTLPAPSSAIMGSEHAHAGSTWYSGHPPQRPEQAASPQIGALFATTTPTAPARCAFHTLVVKEQPGGPPRSTTSTAPLGTAASAIGTHATPSVPLGWYKRACTPPPYAGMPKSASECA